MTIWRLFFRLIPLLLPTLLFSQTGYPEIKSTYIYGDNLFRQHQNALDHSQKIIARLTGSTEEYEERAQLESLLLGDLFFFSYTPKEGDTVYTIGADFSLSPDTIASLNGLERAAYLENRSEVIIPSVPGLYIRQEGGNELERRMRENHREDPFCFPLTLKRNGETMEFLFYPNLSFTGSERLYFISLPFRSPLDHYWEITSNYGMRVHPVTGVWEMHNGIDVRAPRGTAVFAAEKGTIIETTELDNYGIIIILKHRGGYETRYAHLDEIYIKKGDTVARGQMIARTGNTGISTGPHLHFEIRRNGLPVDPVRLVSQGSR
ncbi:MAG: M23 family metallopeptidase [Spirochaetales bacterium]|nr:M23 family metallopeptidase [Spirochaetales bacterium]